MDRGVTILQISDSILIFQPWHLCKSFCAYLKISQNISTSAKRKNPFCKAQIRSFITFQPFVAFLNMFGGMVSAELEAVT